MTEPTAVGVRSSSFRLAAWVVLLLSGLFLLTSGGTYPGIASGEAHVIGQILAIAILGGWLVLAIIRPAWRSKTPLALPVLIASFAYLASALGSQRARLSLEPTMAGLGWALAFLFVGRLLASAWFRARIGVLLTMFVAVVGIGYLVQVAAEWFAWWGIVGRFVVPPLRPSFAALFLGSPNLIATALILASPLAVALAWQHPRRRWLASILAVASVLAIYVSGSRGAYLGTGVGFAVGAFLVWSRRAGVRSFPSDIVPRLRRQPLVFLPLGVLAATFLVFAPSVIQRFAQGGATLRFDLWRAAAAIFVEHPILGGGPGTWVQLKVTANPEGVPNLILPHAHDMYVQAAAELGIVGLVALSWLVFSVVRRLWSAWRWSPADPTAASAGSLWIETGAVIVSLGALTGQSIVDNLSNLPFVCLLVIMLVAWADARLMQVETSDVLGPSGNRGWSARLSGSPLFATGWLIALVAIIPTIVRVDLAAAQAQAGDVHALRGDWQRALDAYDGARRDDPGFTLYELQSANALARVERTAEARGLLVQAVDADPVAVNVIGLAALEAELGERDAARAHARQAVALGWGEAVVALNAGLIAERFGERDAALDAFANAVAWDPPLARSDFWSAQQRIAPKSEVVAAARLRVDPSEGALILAYAGQPLEARAELEALAPSGAVAVYLAAADWLAGDPNAALVRLEARLNANPQDWFAAAWAARIAKQNQDEAAFDRYSKWAIAVQGDAAPFVIAERSMVPAGPDAPTASLPGNYPWAVYLRPITPFLPMPQVVLIGER